MDEKLRNIFIVIVSIMVVFLVLMTSPLKQPGLEGKIVVQQPSYLATTTILPLLAETSLKSNVDLSDWTSVEIATAIAKYNDRLDPKPYNYKYNDDCSYYALYGELFGKDPFCNLVFPTLGPEGQEWNDGHLRIFHMDYDIREPADVKYKNYLDDVLKETQIDRSLYCYTQNECNNIDVIVCTKGTDNYFSWTDGTVLMTSYNDARRNLNAFARFYCSTELKPLTGGIISSLISRQDVIDSISNFIRNI